MNMEIFNDIYEIKDQITNQQFINLNNKVRDLMKEIEELNSRLQEYEEQDEEYEEEEENEMGESCECWRHPVSLEDNMELCIHNKDVFFRCAKTITLYSKIPRLRYFRKFSYEYYDMVYDNHGMYIPDNTFEDFQDIFGNPEFHGDMKFSTEPKEEYTQVEFIIYANILISLSRHDSFHFYERMFLFLTIFDLINRTKFDDVNCAILNLGLLIDRYHFAKNEITFNNVAKFFKVDHSKYYENLVNKMEQFVIDKAFRELADIVY